MIHASTQNHRRNGNMNVNGKPNGSKSKSKSSLSSKFAIAIPAFLFGCILSTMMVLNYVTISNIPNVVETEFESAHVRKEPLFVVASPVTADPIVHPIATDPNTYTNTNPLVGKRILIAIAAFDFNQIPHLGEVLDAYQDLCVTGATKVDVVIHATVAYPVTLIDMMNNRLLPCCKDVFSITIVLKPKSLKLHLVDCHRELFYRKIDDYDLFVYTEDDIRVPPKVVGAYLEQTKKVRDLVGVERSSDFNVGIIRYEYNFPVNSIMDDKTRHATQNVTRVYWEHGFQPVVGESGAVRFLKAPELKDSYFQMNNAHQGMFLATRYLLQQWKVRENCHFDVARNRPGKKKDPHQPSEGTQRVWMSSRMLHGSKHCNVQQVIPIDSFGTLTVLHLPNKNYRRVGRYHNRTFSDGTEKFEVSTTLLTSMRLHVDLRNATKQKPSLPYTGVVMIDDTDNNKGQRRKGGKVFARRMGAYHRYVDRGGILSKDDMGKIDLVE